MFYKRIIKGGNEWVLLTTSSSFLAHNFTETTFFLAKHSKLFLNTTYGSTHKCNTKQLSYFMITVQSYWYQNDSLKEMYVLKVYSTVSFLKTHRERGYLYSKCPGMSSSYRMLEPNKQRAHRLHTHERVRPVFIELRVPYICFPESIVVSVSSSVHLSFCYVPRGSTVVGFFQYNMVRVRLLSVANVNA